MPQSHNQKSAIPNRENPQSEIANQQLRLFVYGTLKRGYWNHDRFCSRAVHIEPATTWGRLYHLPAGYPAIEVPPESILAEGTADPVADTYLQNTIKIPQSAVQLFGNNRHSTFGNQQLNDWDLIHGELMTFNEPGINLPPIDRLEGFNPHGHSMYERVLTTVWNQNLIALTWIYRMKSRNNGSRMKTGSWDRLF